MNAIGTNSRRSSIASSGAWAECKACEEMWRGTDPTLLVACPQRSAEPGAQCLWMGRSTLTSHIARELATLRAGHMSACSALTLDGRHSRDAVLICEAMPGALAA